MTRPTEWLFTYLGKLGPVVKRFQTVFQFDGYVGFWRQHVGPLEFVSPWCCKGAIA